MTCREKLVKTRENSRKLAETFSCKLPKIRKNSQKLTKTRDISRKLAKTQQTSSKHRENSPKSINLAITHKYSRTAVKSRQISTHLAWPRLARTRQNSPTLVHTWCTLVNTLKLANNRYKLTIHETLPNFAKSY